MTSEMFPLAPVSAVADVQLGKMLQPRQLQPDNILRPYVHASNIQEPGQLDLDHSLRKMYFSPREVAALAVEAGDVLLVEGGSVGRPAYVFEDLDGYGFQNSINRVRANDRKASGRFLYHALSSAYQSGEIASYCSSVSIPHFTAEKVSRFRIPLPSLDEQRRIADFLDKETREIDRVVGVLDELIEDLDHRRTTTLEYATSGEMSPKRTDADFKQLKFELDRRFAGDWGEEPGRLDVDVNCVRVADFNRSTNTVTDDVPTVRSIKRQTLNAKHLVDGDILLEKSGGGEKTPVGDAMLYSGVDDAICANFIEVVRPTKKNDPRYWTYLLSAGYASGETRTIIKQTTGIQNLDLQRYFDRVKFLPPLDEQRRIADYLDVETSRIDKMKATATELRGELLARRKALITEYVTGQKRVG